MFTLQTFVCSCLWDILSNVYMIRLHSDNECENSVLLLLISESW